MKFYALYEKKYEGVQVRLDQLESACNKLDIEFIPLNSSIIDYSSLPTLGKKDLLYNVALGSTTLESLLLNSEVTTFYIKNPNLITIRSTTDWSIIHEKSKLPAPKTIFNITTDRELLFNYIEYLGGFPIIIKVAGSSRGIGTIKIETWQNLISTVDYLVTTGDRFIMREFIKVNRVGRCRVLGNEVIESFEYFLIEGDFRNASIPINKLPDVKFVEFNNKIQSDCIKACNLANLEFGSVDVLIDNKNNHYILEVNFPTGMPSDWERDGNYLANKMVEYLMNKGNAK